MLSDRCANLFISFINEMVRLTKFDLGFAFRIVCQLILKHFHCKYVGNFGYI